MWRNRQPCVLLVGMQNGTAAMENSMEGPQKLKIALTYDLILLLLGICPKVTKTLTQDICTPMFTETLFTITKYGSHLSVHRG